MRAAFSAIFFCLLFLAGKAELRASISTNGEDGWLKRGGAVATGKRHLSWDRVPSEAAGQLAAVLDGRGVTTTLTYDDFLRPSTVISAGANPLQNETLAYGYDFRNLVTSAAVTFTDPASGSSNTLTVHRSYDGYGNVTDEKVTDSDGAVWSEFTQYWDAAGRRSLVGFAPQAQGAGGGRIFAQSHQADGMLSRVNVSGQNYDFGYDSRGFLDSKTNPWRRWAVSSRDAQGRITADSNTVGSGTPLLETESWRPDPKLSAYSAARTGAGTWNDNRSYSRPNAYNARGQLVSEPFDNATSAAPINPPQTNAGYSFSGGEAGAGVRALSALGTKAVDSATRIDPFNRVIQETYQPGDNSTQFLSWGFDPMGNTTTRGGGGGGQSLTWDACNRLSEIQQRDQAGNGFDWFAYYDAFGRRLRTVQSPVSNNIENGTPLTTDSFYDPQVEFLELGVAVNSSGAVSGANSGPRTWKVYGPDLNGVYGGLQGIGGLEATIDENSGTVTPVINDAFGDVVGSVSGGAMVWNAIEVGGYGLQPGTPSYLLDGSHSLAKATVWRGHRLDPSGYYYLGARYYDPRGGRFISPDPLGHAASISLYDYANGDPINGCDPDGRCSGPSGSGSFATQANAAASQLLTPVIAGEDAFSSGGQRNDRVVDGVNYTDSPGFSANELLSATLNSIPFAGAAKNLFELGYGRDLVTGDRLSEAQSVTGFALNLGLSFAGAGPIAKGAAAEAALEAGFLEDFGNSASQWQSPLRSAAETTALAGPKCFPAGTLVLMADGSTKPIEQIQKGDNVLAEDPTKPEPPRPFAVAARLENFTKHIVTIDVADVHGRAGQIKATREHPFWAKGCGWKNAKDLTSKDILVDKDSREVKVVGIRIEERTARTFNLTIDSRHTFYVVANGISVLVHNATTLSELDQFDVVPYGQFKNFPYDNLSGHELLQNGWLRANGYGGPTFPDNPAMALPAEFHSQVINPAQANAGLHNPANLATMSAEENIYINAEVLRQAGVPEAAVQQHIEAAIEYFNTLPCP